MKNKLKFLSIVLVVFIFLSYLQIITQASDFLYEPAFNIIEDNITYSDYDESAPVLFNDFEIAEYVLYLLYNGKPTGKFYTPTIAKKPKINYELINTYYPYHIQLKYIFSGKKTAQAMGYTEWTVTPELVNPGIVEKEYDTVINILSELEIDGEDDIDKIKAIHDYIATNTNYDWNGFKTKNYKCPHKGQTAFCSLSEKVAVCGGYSNAFMMLCHYAGVNVAYYSGKAGGAHAWNVVYDHEDNDRYKVVDVTWAYNDVKKEVMDDYYMKNYSEINIIKKNSRKWNSDIDSFVHYMNGKAENTESDIEESDYIVYGTTDSGETGGYINMITEEIRFSEKGKYVVSTDGGDSWKKLKSVSISKLIGKKSIHLVIAKTTDDKKPLSGTAIDFGEIEARPNIKLIAEYKNGAFHLRDKNVSDMELIYTGSTYKNLTVFDYYMFPVSGGITLSSEKMKIKVGTRPILIDENTVVPSAKMKSFTIKAK